ncbi:TonB-dependent receptor plug domain-containing protein, partial [Pseudomonas aeruginosa]
LLDGPGGVAGDAEWRVHHVGVAQHAQARSVADLLQANDPSVRVVGGRGDLVDSYTIRGFSVQNADVAFNGLYGLLPFWRVPIEFAERGEVLKGPNALLGGISPG